MNIVLSGYIDFDLGYTYPEWWKNSTIELYGSWDHWKKGIICNFGVINAKFFVYVPLTLENGTYEYKYKFTIECNSVTHVEWFGDKSDRPHTSIYNNQILIVDGHCGLQLQTIPIFFDRFGMRNDSIYDLKNHIENKQKMKYVIKDEDDLCGICCEPLKGNEYTKCCGNNHVLHKFCMFHWRRYKHTCPICRNPLIIEHSQSYYPTCSV